MGPLAFAVFALAAAPFVLPATAEGDRLLFDAADDSASYLGAIQAYEAAIASGDAPAYLWARKAQALLRLGDLESSSTPKLALYEQGKAAAERGIAADPRCSECWFWRGGTLGRWAETRGMFDSLRALDDIKAAFAKALELDPKNHDTRLALALIDQRLPGFAGGNIVRAETAMRAVVDSAPHFTSAMVDLAELLWDAGKKEEARRWAQKVVDEKNPLHRGAWRKFDIKRAHRLLSSWDG